MIQNVKNNFLKSCSTIPRPSPAFNIEDIVLSQRGTGSRIETIFLSDQTQYPICTRRIHIGTSFFFLTVQNCTIQNGLLRQFRVSKGFKVPLGYLIFVGWTKLTLKLFKDRNSHCGSC